MSTPEYLELVELNETLSSMHSEIFDQLSDMEEVLYAIEDGIQSGFESLEKKLDPMSAASSGGGSGTSGDTDDGSSGDGAAAEVAGKTTKSTSRTGRVMRILGRTVTRTIGIFTVLQQTAMALDRSFTRMGKNFGGGAFNRVSAGVAQQYMMLNLAKRGVGAPASNAALEAFQSELSIIPNMTRGGFEGAARMAQEGMDVSQILDPARLMLATGAADSFVDSIDQIADARKSLSERGLNLKQAMGAIQNAPDLMVRFGSITNRELLNIIDTTEKLGISARKMEDSLMGMASKGFDGLIEEVSALQTVVPGLTVDFNRLASVVVSGDQNDQIELIRDTLSGMDLSAFARNRVAKAQLESLFGFSLDEIQRIAAGEKVEGAMTEESLGKQQVDELIEGNRILSLIKTGMDHVAEFTSRMSGMLGGPLLTLLGDIFKTLVFAVGALNVARIFGSFGRKGGLTGMGGIAGSLAGLFGLKGAKGPGGSGGEGLGSVLSRSMNRGAAARRVGPGMVGKFGAGLGGRAALRAAPGFAALSGLFEAGSLYSQTHDASTALLGGGGAAAGGLTGAGVGGVVGGSLGALLGSVVPVAGTAIGGTLGTIAGTSIGGMFGAGAGKGLGLKLNEMYESSGGGSATTVEEKIREIERHREEVLNSGPELREDFLERSSTETQIERSRMERQREFQIERETENNQRIVTRLDRVKEALDQLGEEFGNIEIAFPTEMRLAGNTVEFAQQQHYKVAEFQTRSGTSS